MTRLEEIKATGDIRPKPDRLPNFLYIGASKAGSTWLYGVLAEHPDVLMAPGKGAYFFDNHFDRGFDWYRRQFSRAKAESVVGEISHSYLHSPVAATRIAECLPDAKLMVCLREPAERAFSSYLDSVKNGRFSGSFEDALRENDSLLERGRYARHIRHYLERFSRRQIHIQLFDDLKADPQRCADDLFAFLGIASRRLASAHRRKMMPAARPRSRILTRCAKRLARLAERVGLQSLRGRLKRSPLVRNLLYSPYAADELPTMNPATRDWLKDQFREEIANLDKILGTSLVARWNYD